MLNGINPSYFGCEPRASDVGGDNGFNGNSWENQYNVGNLPNPILGMGVPVLPAPCYLTMSAGW
jgi:hypothetical protein